MYNTNTDVSVDQGTYLSPILTLSMTMAPVSLTFLPMTQPRPTTLRLIVVRSPTRVYVSTRESDEI